MRGKSEDPAMLAGLQICRNHVRPHLAPDGRLGGRNTRRLRQPAVRHNRVRRQVRGEAGGQPVRLTERLFVLYAGASIGQDAPPVEQRRRSNRRSGNSSLLRRRCQKLTGGVNFTVRRRANAPTAGDSGRPTEFHSPLRPVPSEGAAIGQRPTLLTPCTVHRRADPQPPPH